MDKFSSHTVDLKGQKTLYYEAGSSSGTPLIFIHGWPGIAETWKHQLSRFNTDKYRVLAPDMRGYGGSSSPADKRAYSLETLVAELVELTEKLALKKAIWIAHDWGCGVVSALAAHHPELCMGIAFLSVPYRTLELGVEHLIGLVNRDLYPAAENPYGQWSYQRFYEQDPEFCIQYLSADMEKIIKLVYLKGDASLYGKPARQSRVLEDRGWFGGNLELAPEVPLAATVLDEGLFENLVSSLRKHSFFPPTAYYLNHDVNEEFAKTEKNGGVLDFPVLFIDTKYDNVCTITTTPKMAEGQEELCKDLTQATVDAGHWAVLERAGEVNEALEGWLNSKF
ncbi:Alpha/Beta hydrolase protein [Lophiotrema nucula]|uniref:Alpha/Beta hydrolase protein n=1 Tax=Lophiotrema nucula TaxID=690887 RepID=A0A6A5YQ61_9PLEO|nr:Alpha/Beta hydrolase protein [Lophiotrema nucula]